MDEWLIRGGSIITPDRIVKGDVLIRRGRIARIGPNLQAGKREVVEAKGLYVGPGFIDTHVNGGGGRAFMEGTEKAFETAVNFHLRHGTTGLLPTAVAAPLEELREFLKLVDRFRQSNPTILGAHLNGPFVSLKQCGAMNAEFVIKPSARQFRELVKGLEKVVRIVTLAPEEDASKDLIDEILKIGAIPSLGHSDATYDEARQAIGNGVKHFTHIFNAMRELHHREPGAVGAAIDSNGVTVELIADGIHVHPAVVRFLSKVKESDSIFLVTDAISAAGMSDGEYFLGNMPVLVRDGIARLKTGTFAGSTLTMDRALKNLVEFTGISLPVAMRMASLNPARALGIADRKGSLELGKNADIVIFESNYRIRYTIVSGEILYKALNEKG